MGTVAIAVGSPTPWNMLRSSAKTVERIAKFRRDFKTYLYNFAYPS